MARRLVIPVALALLLVGCAGELARPSASVPAAPPAQSAPPADYTGVVEPQDGYRAFYEIFVGGFRDSDGDGMGDLAGIAEQLDYLQDNRADSQDSLHVTGLWLMPISPSPTYHKYDVTDYYAIDPAYGTMADFEALAAACAERGVALILDLVVNHTSSEHPWFEEARMALAEGRESPYTDWYMFCHEGAPDWYDCVSAWGGGMHKLPGTTGWHYYGQFWSGMPDLNLDNPDVRAEILSIARFWLEKGAAGFRLDAVTTYYEGNNARNTEFLAWLTAELRATHPDVYLVGEAWSDAGTILGLYESGIDSLFNFPFSQSTGEIISAVRSGEGAGLAAAVERWQARVAERNPRGIDAPFLTNHDNTRSAGALMNNLALQKQAAAVYLLLPGNPFIYYGEELGMRGGGERDEDKRMPFVWSAADPAGTPNPPVGAQNQNRVSDGLAEQLADPDSLARFYIQAIAVRNRTPALARGTVTALETEHPALCAYETEWQGERFLVYHNLGDAPLELALTGALIETLAAGGEPPTAAKETLTLPAKSTAVLRLT